MARVQIASLPDGVLTDAGGTVQGGVTVTIEDLAGNAVPTYTTATGSTAASKVTDSLGRLPGWIEEGTYVFSADGFDDIQVEALSGTSRGPRSFGAVGDGSTSDNAAIIAWLAACAGGDAYLPEGTWGITGATIPSDTTLVGPGIFKVLPTTSAYPLYIAPGSHDIFIDVEIDGNKANITGDPEAVGNPGSAIQVDGTVASPCSRINLGPRFYLHDSKRLGVVYNHVTDSLIDCPRVASNDRDGITLFSCTNVRVVSPHISACGDDYIGINSSEGGGGSCKRIQIVNPILVGPGQRNKGRGITVRGGDQIEIDCPDIDSVSQSGICLQDYTVSGTPLALSNVTVTSPIVKSAGSGGANDKDGIQIEALYASVRHVQILDPNIYSCGDSGVRIWNAKSVKADDDVAHIQILGGEIHGNSEHGIATVNTGINDVLVGGGIQVYENAVTGFTNTAANKRIHVRNAHVYRNVTYGVQLRQVQDGSVKDCEIYDDRGGSATQQRGLSWGLLSGTASIGGNNVWGNTVAQYDNTGSNVATFLSPYQVLFAGGTWNPGNLADNAKETKDVTVTGAVVGDVALCSLGSITNAGWLLSASVTASNTVTLTLVNKTGGAVDLASGSFSVEVRKYN